VGNEIDSVLKRHNDQREGALKEFRSNTLDRAWYSEGPTSLEVRGTIGLGSKYI
jgi:hypothetical protein